MPRAAVAVSFAITTAFAMAHGLAAAGSPQATFRVGIDLVSLTVTVTDRAENYVTGLTEHDFSVTEDGVPQPVSFFMSDHIPLDLGIVMDTSGSMGAGLRIVQEAACGLAQSLRAGDRGTVVEVKGGAAVPQPLTDDVPAIQAAIRRTTSGGNTGLYDGLYIVLKEFARDRRDHHDVRRQALVVLSDGADNASHLQFEDVIDLARRSGVAVYIVSPKPAVAAASEDQRQFFSKAQYSMNALAREAGGRIFSASNLRDLNRIYGAIASELATQYELGYVPLRAVADGSFRRVAVSVVSRNDARARTRSGYIAGR